MSDAEKLDLFKQCKAEYKATAKPAVIKMSPAQYLAIDGTGAPGGEAFELRIGALYSVAFTIKMTRKFAGLGDYAVCKLEALWIAPDGKHFKDVAMDEWQWKLLIRTPDFVMPADLDKAAEALLSKGKAEKVRDVKLETLDEGTCVQMLHVGPYETIGQSYTKMGEFADAKGLVAAGLPHDIYLSDPRRVDPSKLKTIIRRPVQ